MQDAGEMLPSAAAFDAQPASWGARALAALGGQAGIGSSSGSPATGLGLRDEVQAEPSQFYPLAGSPALRPATDLGGHLPSSRPFAPDESPVDEPALAEAPPLEVGFGAGSRMSWLIPQMGAARPRPTACWTRRRPVRASPCPSLTRWWSLSRRRSPRPWPSRRMNPQPRPRPISTMAPCRWRLPQWLTIAVSRCPSRRSPLCQRLLRPRRGVPCRQPLSHHRRASWRPGALPGSNHPSRPGRIPLTKRRPGTGTAAWSGPSRPRCWAPVWWQVDWPAFSWERGASRGARCWEASGSPPLQ